MSNRPAYRETTSLDPLRGFGRAWLAAFLGFVLILGVIFWAMIAFST
jgi:hypothetical protein